MPEGYEFVKFSEQSLRLKSEWAKNSGEYIVLVQCNVENALFVMDDEADDWKLVSIGRHEIYCRFTGIYHYIWNDGEYAYQLTVSTELPEQELISMIEGLKIKE